METQKETQKNEWWQVYEKLGSVLKEFVDWYIWRYNMPVEISIDSDYVSWKISWNIEKEREMCVKACVEKWGGELKAEGYSDEEIKSRCYDTCDEEVSEDTNYNFGEIRLKLREVLDKHGFKYDWEEAWEGDTKYLVFKIKF